MSLNFTYTALPPRTSESLGYAGSSSNNTYGITTSGFGVSLTNSASSIYTFSNIPVGTYMFTLNGFMGFKSTILDAYFLIIYLTTANSTTSYFYYTYTPPAFGSGFGSAPDPSIICVVPMTASCVFVNTTSNASFYVLVQQSQTATYANTAYYGSIQLVRLA